ncbi:hypothetical protein VB711_17410 [Cronbergia sp. UHCC 0137]|uniref:HEAT repeat domain-containing protein n=1 Tax=Cronbergia sp. UHCC 0137 TaxID=3110239 RepID=UPI002B21259E|nr:hypothetical protein [Cronbergia sp. UHCC 0137]MEA5619605.1 hypothetical protein [Cronbergia sp. UHCC 0137]
MSIKYLILIFSCCFYLGLDSTHAITANNGVSVSKTNSINSPDSKTNFIWWSLLGLGILGSGGVILYFIKKNPTNNHQQVLSISKTPPQTKIIPSTTTSLVPQLNVVDEMRQIRKMKELIQDLQNIDPSKRSKAIWNLGEEGDSRAIEPLLELMINADSQQHSLILSALAEITIHTLQPVNRALAISIQDKSPEVRQNAIRDLVRIYDMMTQMSQMLRYAVEDTDPEVQATAEYALDQIKRLRIVAETQTLPENLQ